MGVQYYLQYLSRRPYYRLAGIAQIAGSQYGEAYEIPYFICIGDKLYNIGSYR